ncbi:MAG: HEAT repeat domain-containing protein [Kiritimatiellia bacterium]
MQSPVFLVNDLEALRKKISGLTGVWEKRWREFCRQAALEKRSVRWYSGSDTPNHAAFAALITDGAKWKQIARRDLLWMKDRYAETLEAGTQDSDTWIHAAPMARRAIALDWMWDADVFSGRERDELVELFITDSLKYPHVTLHHRVPPHANNQGMAQALNCVVVGYLFGVKHGNDARARYLLEFALPHLAVQIAYLPPDGYSGEGSTYVVLVADPLTALCTAVLEELSGENWFERELWPNRNTPAKILNLNARLIPPSGLLPAWDQHGYHLEKAGTTAAYLAHRTGDPGGYTPYVFGEGWAFSGSFAWMKDDHVWQWLWMPDPASVPEPGEKMTCYPNSWAEQRVGGALLDRSATKHLFQMWDIASSMPGRVQVNPNSVLLEAWESVLTVDGNATEDFPLSRDPRTRFVHWSMTPPKEISWAQGALGAHSCIWVDGDLAHVPSSPGFLNLPDEVTAGFLRRRVNEDRFQLLSAEVANFYQNAYDVHSMIRNSALIDNTFWVMLDQVKAGSPHEFTWQLVLRHGAVSTDYGARLTTAEQVVLDVVNLDGGHPEMLDVPGYPSTLEQRCHQYRKRLHGDELEFTTVLIPRLARRELADWTSGWRAAWTGDANQDAPDSFGGEVELTEAWYDRPDESAVLWVTRECRIPDVAEGEWLLELPRTYPPGLWIDGREIEVPFLMSSHHGEPRLMAPFIPVSEFCGSRGVIRVTMRIPRPRYLIGSVKLHARTPVGSPDVVREGDEIRVNLDGGCWTVDLRDIRTPPEPLPHPHAEGKDPIQEGERLARKVMPDGPEAPTGWNGDAAARGAACCRALYRPLSEVEDHLMTCADEDTDWLVRLLAIRALGMLRSLKALPLLCDCLRRETTEKIWDPAYPPKYRIKEMCVVALAKIGHSDAVPEVMACMTPEDFYGVRRLAAKALGTLGDPRALPVLNEWADDSDGETAQAAQRAVEQLNKPRA